MRKRLKKILGPLALVPALFALAGQGSPASAADASQAFYQGKTITVYIGYGPGGTYDSTARLLARHFSRFIPGRPTIVAQNRPGAGSISLANELYTSAPRDGTVIGTIGDILVVKQVLNAPGISFVAARFNWIGRLVTSDSVFAVRPDSGLSSIEEARTKSISVGVPGAGSATALDISVLNRLIGTKLTIISGYDGASEVKLAMERGEVAASGSLTWQTDGSWIRANGYRVLYQKTLERSADLPGVPRMIDLARNDDDRQLLRLFNSQIDVARSFLAPPGVPEERIRILRTAFMEMSEDPALRAEAEKLRLSLGVLSGEQLQKSVEQAGNIPQRLRAMAIEAAGASLRN